MKIAGISMTYNDGFKIKEWRENYEVFKDQIDSFIIVDNGSNKEYQELLKSTFSEDVVIIYRETNGGCTAAYNDGIKYALEESDAEAIAILGNDVQPTKECLPKMYEYLFSDESLGIVSAAILNKNSDIVDNYGHTIKGMNVIYCDRGKNITDITPKRKFTELVSGGFTMAKREFYKKAGLQDEALFMYGDELDTMFKARLNNYKIGVIADEYAWHRHINPPKKNRRPSASRYLISRNRVYLAKKYMGTSETIKQFVRGSLVIPAGFILHFLRGRQRYYLSYAKYSLVGAIHGLIGKMYTNKYTEL